MTVAYRVHKDNVFRADELIEFTGQQHRTVWDHVIIQKHHQYNLRLLCLRTGVMYDVEFVSHTIREKNKAPVFIFRKLRKSPIDCTLSLEQNLRIEPKWLTFFKHSMVPVDEEGRPRLHKRANKSGFVICKHMQAFSDTERDAYLNFAQYAFQKESYRDELINYINDKCHKTFQKLDDEYVAHKLLSNHA